MRNFLAGFFCASAIAIVSMAAPFNATVTRRADLASTQCVNVCKNPDGGVSYTPELSVPEDRNLPDGGNRTDITTVMGGRCEISNATVRTNVLSFMNNQALMCGRVTADLEQ